MRAAENDDVELARLLVESGADKDLANNAGLTAPRQALGIFHVFPYWV